MYYYYLLTDNLNLNFFLFLICTHWLYSNTVSASERKCQDIYITFMYILILI